MAAICKSVYFFPNRARASTGKKREISLEFCPDRDRRTKSKGQRIKDNDKRMNEISQRLRKLSWIGKEAKTGLSEVKESVGTVKGQVVGKILNKYVCLHL